MKVIIKLWNYFIVKLHVCKNLYIWDYLVTEQKSEWFQVGIKISQYRSDQIIVYLFPEFKVVLLK